jgi:hypothetical protein
VEPDALGDELGDELGDVELPGFAVPVGVVDGLGAEVVGVLLGPKEA